jgi:hypothetical protein
VSPAVPAAGYPGTAPAAASDPPGGVGQPRRVNWVAAERVRWIRGLRPVQRRLLGELAWESASDTGLVCPGSEEALAARVEAHVTSMRNALHALIEAGHVHRVRRGARGRPAVYRIPHQSPAATADPAPAAGRPDHGDAAAPTGPPGHRRRAGQGRCGQWPGAAGNVR